LWPWSDAHRRTESGGETSAAGQSVDLAGLSAAATIDVLD
jgi:hypothetical protein